MIKIVHIKIIIYSEPYKSLKQYVSQFNVINLAKLDKLFFEYVRQKKNIQYKKSKMRLLNRTQILKNISIILLKTPKILLTHCKQSFFYFL